MTGIKSIHPLIDAQKIRRAADYIARAQAILEENDRGLWADELSEKCAEMMSRADRLEREFYASQASVNVAPIKREPANVIPMRGAITVFDFFRNDHGFDGGAA